jgi:hypothetical protein
MMVAKRLWALGIVLSLVVVRPSPAAEVPSANYGRAGELAIAPALIPLPPGAVEPAGWLRDWALAARNGLTGHLDDYCPTFRDGWKGFRVEAPDFSLADGTGAPLEQSSYWLDGLVRLGYALHDDALIQKAKARLDLVVNGVNRGGTSFSWSMTWLYRIEGQRDWGDRIERALFNAAPAPIARDFQTMCYYQSSNRIGADSLPEEQPVSPGRGSLRFTCLGHPHVLCCVAAVNRIVPSYIQHMWMATADQGFAATLYGPAPFRRWPASGCTKFRISMFPVTARAWGQEPPTATAEPEG